MSVKVRFTYYNPNDVHTRTAGYSTREGELYKVDGSHYHLLDDTREGKPRTFLRSNVYGMEVMAVDPEPKQATPTCNELDYAILFFRK
jgi:hypothetical protein